MPEGPNSDDLMSRFMARLALPRSEPRPGNRERDRTDNDCRDGPDLEPQTPNRVALFLQPFESMLFKQPRICTARQPFHGPERLARLVRPARQTGGSGPQLEDPCYGGFRESPRNRIRDPVQVRPVPVHDRTRMTDRACKRVIDDEPVGAAALVTNHDSIRQGRRAGKSSPF